MSISIPKVTYLRRATLKARVEQDEKGRKTVDEPCMGPCPIERGMRVLGGKWTGSILWHLKDEPVRFNDLTRMVGGASKKLITDRLRQLEEQGLIERRVIETSPMAVEYQVTEFGRSAVECLDALRQWSEGLPPALIAHIISDEEKGANT